MRVSPAVIIFFLLILLCGVAYPADYESSTSGNVIDINRCIEITLEKNFNIMESIEELIEREADYYVQKDTLSTKVEGSYKGGVTSTPVGYEQMDVRGELSYKMPMGDTLNASGELVRTNFINRPGNDFSFEYRYPLAKGGGVIIGWKDIRKAQRNLTIQELRYFVSKQDVVLTAIKRYFDLLKAKKLIAVNESAVENARDNLRITRRKFEEGLVPKIDLTRAEIRFVDAQDGLLSAQKNWADTRDSLLQQMGLDPRKNIEIDYDVAYFPKEFEEDECIELALLLRKELLVSMEELFQKREDVIIAQNNMKPQMDLVTSYSYTAKDWLFTGIEAIKYPAWSAMLECSIDISNRSLKEELLKSKRLVYLFEQRQDDTKRGIVKEVRENLRQIRLAAERVELRDKNLKAAEERLHLATRSWEEGLITNREVVDAQQDLVRAQTDLLQAKIDYILAEYALRKSIGYDLANMIAEEMKKGRQSTESSRKYCVDYFLGVGSSK